MSASDFETEVKPCASRRLRFGIVVALTLLLSGAAAMLLLDERLKPADDLMPRRPVPAPQDNGWERLHTLWGDASGVDRNDRRLWLEVLGGKRAWDEELALRIISRGRDDLLLKAKEALSLPESRLPPPNRHVESSGSDRFSFFDHLYTIQARILSSARRGDMKPALEFMLVLAELQRRNLSGATSGTLVLSNFGSQIMLLQAVPWLTANGTSADDALWAALQGALLRLEITPDDLDEALRGEAAILLEMTREEGTGPFSIYIGERLERLLFRKKRSFNRVAAFYRSVRGDGCGR